MRPLRVFKHALRGYGHTEVGRVKDALAAFDRALQLNPHHPLARHGMVRLHRGLRIDRLGEDISRWPDGQRVAAEELFTSSREARALLEEARTLRQALAGPPVRAPAGLADRIVTAAAKLNAEVSRADDETATDAAGVTHSG